MCGIKNYTGNTPIYIKSVKLKTNKAITVMEFFANGISLEDWQKKSQYIQCKFNRKVIGIQEKGNDRILLYLRKDNSPDTVYWNDDYLRTDNNEGFTLVLGETPFGEQETINLSIVPHILIGGRYTGHGKTVLLKLLLMQCLKKQADVYIADFKRGY
jgi:S-DNA-T family DNA segregation ATPase FtsK/SpoIIIE